jgi:cystathionine gamma-lyase
MSKGCLPEFKNFSTIAIHAGQPADPQSGAVIPPISVATTFKQKSPGVNQGFEYGRTGNPTRKAYEECVATMEGGKYGLAFASGSAATVTILSMYKTGDHVITIDDVYGGTNRFFSRISAVNSGIIYEFVDMSVEGALEKAFKPNTKLVWLETPTNPNLKVVDIEKVAKLSHAHGAILVVDNTFLSPFFQRPLSLGADIAYNSVSKYINGHSDVIGGVLAMNNEELYKKLAFLQNGIGAIPSPLDCFLVMRGAKTLAVRMRQHESNAMAVAKLLEGHPKVDRVAYPGLASHPQHEIAKKQQTGFGGMVTFWLKGGLEQSRQFLENLHLFQCAESLGSVESLAEHPAIMTHASVPPDQRKKLGISDTMVRLSVGIEDQEDILADLKTALDAVKL